MSGRSQLFVGRLPLDVRERDIENIFEKYGRLLRCDVKYGTGMAYAFVDYDDRRDAEDAIKYENGRELRGQSIVVEWARGPSFRPSSHAMKSGGGRSRSIYDECYHCRHSGHWARDCPELERDRFYRRRRRSYSRSRSKSKDHRPRHKKSRSRSRSHERSKPNRSRTRSRSSSGSRSRSRSREGGDDKVESNRDKDRSRSHSASKSRSRSHESEKHKSKSPSAENDHEEKGDATDEKKRNSKDKSRSRSRSHSASKSPFESPKAHNEEDQNDGDAGSEQNEKWGSSQ
ncbi:serine/arginine-rich splicing factor 4-like isoform X2 [Limulus polyphemus]|uniref:Serine/arginine-rich splicing factor 4-like isoform X2 n=1 Tax=Limulus polyphemus TaxID=6850 RepID=A0ABM1BPN4_LIMPO|nr:serine/arginine-rich splicing factor 4-like isoform X2 [Limulus polyphemus]